LAGIQQPVKLDAVVQIAVGCWRPAKLGCTAG